MSKRFYPILSILLAIASSLPLAAQTKSVDTEGHKWWQHAVFYEIYPRSFADSNNDGIGDLKGITSKMAYLHDLGVDAIWISPCFPSPQVDFGYDVSDYENIDPMYGTLADFDGMVAEGKTHGVRIILDFVVNHSSDQHQWFVDSKSSRSAQHRDWYIWRDGKGPGQPPNNLAFVSMQLTLSSKIRGCPTIRSCPALTSRAIPTLTRYTTRSFPKCTMC